MGKAPGKLAASRVFRTFRRPTKTTILHTYRSLLRSITVVQNPGQRPDAIKNTRWKQYVTNEYRKNMTLTNSDQIAKLHNVAFEYNTLLKANVAHEGLLLQGGWGSPQSQQEAIEAVVRTVGLASPIIKEELQLPKVKSILDVDDDP